MQRSSMATSTDCIDDNGVSQATVHVNISGRSIETLVTHTPYMVDSWIAATEALHTDSLQRLIVGLDIEWRPNDRYCTNPVATLQLCVGYRCLIFKFLYAPYIPYSLRTFLATPGYVFVGVGISDDADKLRADHGLEVSNVADLRSFAAAQPGHRNLINASLKTLASVFLGEHIEKPMWVTRSMWDQDWLTHVQVHYACTDAFISFEIGRYLIYG